MENGTHSYKIVIILGPKFMYNALLYSPNIHIYNGQNVIIIDQNLLK